MAIKELVSMNQKGLSFLHMLLSHTQHTIIKDLHDLLTGLRLEFQVLAHWKIINILALFAWCVASSPIPPCLSDGQKGHSRLIAHNEADPADKSCPVQSNVSSSCNRHSALAQIYGVYKECVGHLNPTALTGCKDSEEF